MGDGSGSTRISVLSSISWVNKLIFATGPASSMRLVVVVVLAGLDHAAAAVLPLLYRSQHLVGHDGVVIY